MYTNSTSNKAIAPPILAVFLPILLTLIAIFSTFLPIEIQSHFVFGLPFILWVWFAISFLICVLTIIASYKVIVNVKTNTDNNQ